MSRKLSIGAIPETYNESERRQYVLVESKRHRRNSAPEYLGNQPMSGGLRTWYERQFWLRASTSDLSVLLDDQTESGSSLELDTSNLSRNSPAPTLKDNMSDSTYKSYQTVPTINFEVYRQTEGKNFTWNVFCSGFIWKVLIMSQGMAACLTIMKQCSASLQNNGPSVIGQCFANYVFLCILWTTRLALRNNDRGIVKVLKLCGLRYVLLSILHVEANFLLLSSFKQESYMGNQTIDLVAASLALVLTYVCLEVKFQITHVNGFAMAMIGGIGFCIANATSKKGEDEICWGDILHIGSGIFLALNNLAQELIVKSIDSVEYLGMIGLLGCLVSGLQVVFFNEEKLFGTLAYWLSIVQLSAVQVIFNCVTPKLLRDIGAAGLHLSLLSSEFYTYFVYSFGEGNQLYVASYGLAFLGSFLFDIKRTHMGTHHFFPIKVIIPKGI